MDNKFKIADIKVSIVKTQSAGADYTDHAEGHWINDTIIANPMSRYPVYQTSRSKWGMDAIKGIFIEVTTEITVSAFAILPNPKVIIKVENIILIKCLNIITS